MPHAPSTASATIHESSVRIREERARIGGWAGACVGRAEPGTRETGGGTTAAAGASAGLIGAGALLTLVRGERG